MSGAGNGRSQPKDGASRLPIGYNSLVPLTGARHDGLRFRHRTDFRFARSIHAAPLSLEEFPRAHFHYPIVFSRDEAHFPAALLGGAPGRNDFVDGDGAWKENVYVPAFIRRFPFALAREGPDSDRMLLCADLTAANFKPDGGKQEEVLFENGEPTEFAKKIVEFCNNVETALAKTRRAAAQLSGLKLFEDAQVTVQRPGRPPIRIDGFQIVSEKKLRALNDAALADLARRGVLGLVAAHHFSVARFSGIMSEQA